jgi:hypothetical protein
MKTILIIFFSGWIISICHGQYLNTPYAYEAYYHKISSYPEDATNDWNPPGTEIQGVTHDNENWYFTNTDYDGGNARLWKIPVYYALDQNTKGLQGVKEISMVNTPELNKRKYNHWGDPDHYKYNETDYILIPMTSGDNLPPAIGVFRGSDLYFITFSTFPAGGNLPDIGWCAISKEGDLFTSPDNAQGLLQYSIDWQNIESNPPVLSMTYKSYHQLFISNGIALSNWNLLHNMQGGEFTPSGQLLYISCGSGECMGFGHGIYNSDGIHVFETSSWKEIKRSINSQKGQSGLFDFSFDNSCACLTGSQTPEGLTIWDLDDGRAPYSTGQLHVLKNFYNRYAACDDALSIQHFRRIWMDTSGYGQEPPLVHPFMGIKLYEHPDYLGDSRYFSFDIPDLDLGTVNFADVASSVRLFNIKEVKLYDGRNYTGPFLTVSQDIPDLTPVGWNDRIGSLRIIRIKK